MDHINRLMEKAAKARAVAWFFEAVKHRENFWRIFIGFAPIIPLIITKEHLTQLTYHGNILRLDVWGDL